MCKIAAGMSAPTPSAISASRVGRRGIFSARAIRPACAHFPSAWPQPITLNNLAHCFSQKRAAKKKTRICPATKKKKKQFHRIQVRQIQPSLVVEST